jgi:hypothetical protein
LEVNFWVILLAIDPDAWDMLGLVKKVVWWGGNRPLFDEAEKSFFRDGEL